MPEFASEEDFERHRKQYYPRGSGPPLKGEDDPHYLDPDGASLDDHDPDKFLSDPGFGEHEVDTHFDPDHGREDKLGGVMRQSDQYGFLNTAAYTGHGETESEIQAKHPHAPVGGDVKRLRGEDTGLYGTDESDTYDVYGKPSPDGKGWDVIRPVGG